MKSLVDTTVLLRMMNRAHSHYSIIGLALKDLTARSMELVLAPQVIFEAYVVATRPQSVRGFGFRPDEGCHLVRHAMSELEVLPDPADLLTGWLRLCEVHEVSGKPAHDARLVAWMDAHAIAQLVTLNPADFRRYSHITLIVPGETA